MELKYAVEDGTGTRFVPLIADDEWIAKHGTDDRDETAAVAMQHAEHGVQLYQATVARLGGGNVSRIRLTSSIPNRSIPLLNPELGVTQGLTCYICLCDDASPPNCVCTPC